MLGTLAFAGLVLVLYQVSVHLDVPNSDGATVVLQGQAMRSGNVLLRNWHLSFDSFWGIDALVYAVTEVFTGLRAQLMYFVPALIAAMVVVAGAIVARGSRRGGAGLAAAATVVVFLGLPSLAMSAFYLTGPLHVGTTLWCLLAFAGLAHGRSRAGWVAAVVLFAAGALGDLLIIPLGIAPTFLAGLVAMLRTRHWRAGMRHVTAAAAGLVLAVAARAATLAVGAFSISPGHPTASSSQLAANIGHVFTWGAPMLGVGDGAFGPGWTPAPLQAVRLVTLLLVALGLLVAAVSLARGVIAGPGRRAWRPRAAPAGGNPPAPAPEWMVDDLLLLAFVGSIATFLVFSASDDPGYYRYLTPAVIFGAVLAGRLVGRVAGRVPGRWFLRIGTVAGLLTAGSFAAGIVLDGAGAQPNRPYVGLGHFLESHGLDEGLGDYWSASIVTVVTDGKVSVRPVIANARGRLVPYGRQSTSDWYRGKTFDFLTFDRANPWGGVDTATATATFGAPAHSYVVGAYRVLVWDHPVTLAP